MYGVWGWGVRVERGTGYGVLWYGLWGTGYGVDRARAHLDTTPSAVKCGLSAVEEKHVWHMCVDQVSRWN